jgi:hypothetical protein
MTGAAAALRSAILNNGINVDSWIFSSQPSRSREVVPRR